jgi:H+/Cl- antiporter ClcA
LALFRQFLLAAGTGVLAGCCSWLFLLALQWACDGFLAQPARLVFLPFVGVLTVLFYQSAGKSVGGGANLLIDEIHSPSRIIPIRMAPMIFLTTILSHAFGASTGREGTAVQMGGSLADQISRYFKVSPRERVLLLVCGICAGFSSVFGTPLAGMVFGMEVLQAGRLRYAAFAPALIASVTGHMVCMGLGASHETYITLASAHLGMGGIVKLCILGICAGLIARLFVWLTHRVEALAKSRNRPLATVMFAGVLVNVIVFLFPVTPCLGLSLPLLREAFVTVLPIGLLAGKIVLTALCVGSGFRGGEVTPLFVMGALLGNTCSWILSLPLDLAVACGFVAVFAGATNTPLACTFMAMEMFGSGAGMGAAVACAAAYLCSGSGSVYMSQRKRQQKFQILRR